MTLRTPSSDTYSVGLLGTVGALMQNSALKLVFAIKAQGKCSLIFQILATCSSMLPPATCLPYHHITPNRSCVSCSHLCPWLIICQAPAFPPKCSWKPLQRTSITFYLLLLVLLDYKIFRVGLFCLMCGTAGSRRPEVCSWFYWQIVWYWVPLFQRCWAARTWIKVSWSCDSSVPLKITVSLSAWVPLSVKWEYCSPRWLKCLGVPGWQVQRL